MISSLRATACTSGHLWYRHAVTTASTITKYLSPSSMMCYRLNNMQYGNILLTRSGHSKSNVEQKTVMLTWPKLKSNMSPYQKKRALMMRNATKEKEKRLRNRGIIVQRPPRKFKMKKEKSGRQMWSTRSIKEGVNGPWESPKIGTKDELTFEKLIRSELVTALEGINVSVPTKVQAISIPTIRKGRNVFFSAETGSGKTLSYLLPIFERMIKDNKEGLVVRAKRPTALIVVPTRELADQVLEVAKQLSKNVPVSGEGNHAASIRIISSGAIGGRSMRHQRKRLDECSQLLVGTPGRILRLIAENRLYLSDLKSVVIDECDTLFDQSFREDILKIIKPVTLRHLSNRNGIIPNAQLVFSTATVSKEMLSWVEKEVPNTVILSTGNAHRPMPNMFHQFIRCKGSNGRREEFLTLIRAMRREGHRVMVFCNRSRDVDLLYEVLKLHDYPTIRLHGELQADNRVKELRRFQQGEADILLATDIAARGIDPHDCSHLILYDFPGNITNYVHRIGRVGRMGKAGYVYSLLRTTDLKLAHEIRMAMAHDAEFRGLSDRVEKIKFVPPGKQVSKHIKHGYRPLPPMKKANDDTTGTKFAF